MVQVPVSSYHIILAELHTGMLVLAGICILTLALVKVLPGIKKLAPRLAGSLDSTSYVATIVGTIVLVISGIVGLLIYPLQVLPMAPVVENKIMFAVFALNTWIVVAAIRIKFGSGVWNSRLLGTVYTIAAVAGLGFVTISGCTSAHIGKKISPLDPIWELLGVNLDKILTIPQTTSYAFIAAGLALIVVALALLLIKRKKPPAPPKKNPEETLEKPAEEN